MKSCILTPTPVEDCGGFTPDPYDTNLGSPFGHAAYETKLFVC